MAFVQDLSFDKVPALVIWEMTRSCFLRCIHCRAEAIRERNPNELTINEAKSLLTQVSDMGGQAGGFKPLVVLTGGDPIRYPDVMKVVEYGSDLGLHMAMTPSATPEINFETIRRLKDKGLKRLAVSLDGPNAKIHDTFRQVNGSFDWTLKIIRWARKCELPVQINTTITRHNFNYMNLMIRLLRSLDIAMWSVFFLVPTGRGKKDDSISAREAEQAFFVMNEAAKDSGFDIKSTEAPAYRRYVLKHRRNGLGRPRHARFNINSGKGFVFISHTGDVQPSGFLPIKAGSVKENRLADIYRNSDIFRKLRDESKLKGKCGLCEYKKICGGSRSRAYALTGDYLESDPLCAYEPESARRHAERL